jgi:hypothetical protein
MRNDPTGRALQPLSLLQTHRLWRGAELAERLEVTDRTVRGHRQAACEHMCRYGRPNSSPLVVTFDRDCPLQMSVSMACLT